MENINGDPSPPERMESADGGGEAIDFDGVSYSDAVTFAQARIERAQAKLRYGRRQEAEDALRLLEEAHFALRAAAGQRE